VSRFNFRLQKVLDLKERLAQAAAAQLVAAHVRAEEARDALVTLAAIREAGGAQLAAAHSGATAGQMQNISYLLEKLDLHVDQASEVAEAAQSGLADAQAELTLAHQAKRALDRLRERDLGDWQQTLTQNDRQQMDAIALSRFTRQSSPITDET
jgi:flagellar export protein FliJ